MKLTFLKLTLILSISAFAIHAAEKKFDISAEKTFLSGIVNVSTDSEWIEKLNKYGTLSQQADLSRIPKQSDRPLFRAYPNLRKFPHVAVCSLPTPIEKLNQLSTQCNIPVYIKRDDLTGGFNADGERLYGGNKPRKFEFLGGQALAHGAKSVITFGCVGSNHARAVATYAHELGLHASCFLAHQPNSAIVQENLLSHLANRSTVQYHVYRPMRTAAAVNEWIQQYHATGSFPYIIPTGGSNEVGALGFVNAGFELAEQIRAGIMQKPTRVYVPCGSCATTVGLALGCKLAGLNCQIIAVAVEPEDELDMFRKTMEPLTNKTVALLRSYDDSIPSLKLEDLNITLRLEFAGPDYGVFTKEGNNAQLTLKEQENLNVEGTYMAKAAAALFNDVKSLSSDETLLLWNTYCGCVAPKGLMRNAHEQLPLALQEYFKAEAGTSFELQQVKAS